MCVCVCVCDGQGHRDVAVAERVSLMCGTTGAAIKAQLTALKGYRLHFGLPGTSRCVWNTRARIDTGGRVRDTACGTAACVGVVLAHF